MTRRSKVWLAGAAVVYGFINVAGAGYAIAMGEQRHAAFHGVLLLLGVGAYLIWLLATRATRREKPRLPEGDQRIDYLQQSVDAVALEVERIGEAQRFNDKIRVERGETPPLKKQPPEE